MSVLMRSTEVHSSRGYGFLMYEVHKCLNVVYLTSISLVNVSAQVQSVDLMLQLNFTVKPANFCYTSVS